MRAKIWKYNLISHIYEIYSLSTDNRILRIKPQSLKKKKHSKLITIYSFLENFHRKNAGKSRPDRKLHIPGVPWPGSSESQEQQLSVPVDSPQQTRHSLFKPRNLLHEQLFCKNWVGCLCTHMKIDVKN